MARADKLFKRLRAARLDNSVETEMRRLAHTQLLIIDVLLNAIGYVIIATLLLTWADCVTSRKLAKLEQRHAPRAICPSTSPPQHMRRKRT
ncbi:hypothetical protein [Nonomuraea basaltis]|uniref:hypothetical protein n=1 Tax=Nonomuraea basaltis TaxID=2495887 RepID=UPI00110C62D6|nr:hypothetical protein [Nonomuraea basaltis]TMR91072.1 hypothetical protein EJK15_51950 [Nonomuraea basaltis]